MVERGDGGQRPPGRFALLDIDDKALPRIGIVHQHGLSHAALNLGCAKLLEATDKGQKLSP